MIEVPPDLDQGVQEFPTALLTAIDHLAMATVAWRNLDKAQRAAAAAGKLRPIGELLLVHHALDGLIEMVRAVPDWTQFALPLERLRLAIVELEIGKTVEWLQPHRPVVNDDGHRRSGSARQSFVMRLQRGRVVRISKYLKGRVRTYSNAAKIISEAASNGFAEALDGKLNAKTLEHWRAQVRNSEAGSPERQGYNDAGQLLDVCRELWDSCSPEKAAEYLMRGMAEKPL